MFPYPHYCSLTPAALYAKLARPLPAVERAAILFILESRMRRAAATT